MVHAGIDTLSTAIGLLHIMRVDESELDRILLLMQEASDWLHSRGIQQWRRMYTAEGRAMISARFTTDDVYLAFQDKTPVATFTLRWQESSMWGDAGYDGTAGYLHGFTVSRRVGGHAVGEALLAWLERQVEARGRRFLRLNTTAGNPGICRYYERIGFRPCGVVAHVLGGLTQLYEREVGKHR